MSEKYVLLNKLPIFIEFTLNFEEYTMVVFSSVYGPVWTQFPTAALFVVLTYGQTYKHVLALRNDILSILFRTLNNICSLKIWLVFCPPLVWNRQQQQKRKEKELYTQKIFPEANAKARIKEAVGFLFSK